MERRMTKEIRIGNRKIGGETRFSFSRCNTKTEDAAATVAQILKLEQAGCDIIRVAVPTMEAAEPEGDQTPDPHSVGGRYSF